MTPKLTPAQVRALKRFADAGKSVMRRELPNTRRSSVKALECRRLIIRSGIGYCITLSGHAALAAIGEPT